MIPIKICGITNLEDARLAVDLGAAAVGFIFYKASPRYVDPDQARTMISKLGEQLRKVGVFVNTSPDRINRMVVETGLDMVQLSGHELPELCQDITVPVIKALHIGPDFNRAMIDQYDVHAFLLDTHQSGSFGGTGMTFNWSQIEPEIFKRPTILSGGLTLDNVVEGISSLRPSAVDLNSGIEVRPGVKDRIKMERLFMILETIEGSNDQVF